AGNRLAAPRNGETLARDYAHDVLQSVDPYALVVTAGDNATCRLGYAQEVDGVRKDVSVLVLSLANTGWYVRQLQRRAPPTFDAGAAPDLYRGRVWPRPTAPWMSRFYLGDAADTLPDYIPLAQPATGHLGPIAVALDPARLGRPYLMRSDLAVLQIIKDELGKRPIYFSTSTGNYADQLGLSSYLVGEGLVRRLVPRPVAAGDGVWRGEGRRFVDVRRSAALLSGAHHGGEASVPARGPPGPGRPRAVRVDAGAGHAVRGHMGIARRRAGARRPASAREPVVRPDRARLGLVAARGGVRDARQPAGGVH